jgi:hypothetical protein
MRIPWMLVAAAMLESTGLEPSHAWARDHSTIAPNGISRAQAWVLLLETGIDPADIVFFDIAPFDEIGDGTEFRTAWAGVIETEDAELLGTFLDDITGDVLAELEVLHPGLENHLRVDLNVMRGATITAKDVYDSYPWGYDLPTNWGNHLLTCGYGCDYHNGSNFYAVDLDTYDRECVPAPGSGYVMFAGWDPSNSGYGNQVIVKGSSIGGGQSFLYRIAHFDALSVVPGWWVDKNRTLGLAGRTGNATGSHVHFSIHRGTHAGGGRISGDSVPLDRWPGPNDRVDYFDRFATWQFSFNACR